MPVITLTTEWRASDYYIGAMKGALLSKCPEAQIIDLAHEIQTYNVIQTAFILKNNFYLYPPETIHIVCVDTEEYEEKRHVVMKFREHFFIGTDNGIFSLISEDQPYEAVEINPSSKNELSTFPELNVFTRAAQTLYKNKNIDSLGGTGYELSKQTLFLPVIDDNMLNGNVVYIDSYKNAVTNIHHDLFRQIGKNRKFDIYVQSYHHKYKTSRINLKYGETEPGELLAIFNSLGFLEIAINKGPASEL